MDFLGRWGDWIIKSRFEVIESNSAKSRHLGELTGVQNAVVVSVENETTHINELATYIIVEPSHGEKISVELVKSHLADTVPDYMVTTYVEFLSRFPLTANGKVDRKALPQPGKSSSVVNTVEYRSPTTDMQQQLAEIWRRVLKLDRGGLDDDFFALGGHSISAAQIAHDVRQKLGVDSPLSGIFEAPNFRRQSNCWNLN